MITAGLTLETTMQRYICFKNIYSFGSTIIRVASVTVKVFETGRKSLVVRAQWAPFPLCAQQRAFSPLRQLPTVMSSLLYTPFAICNRLSSVV